MFSLNNFWSCVNNPICHFMASDDKRDFMHRIMNHQAGQRKPKITSRRYSRSRGPVCALEVLLWLGRCPCRGMIYFVFYYVLPSVVHWTFACAPRPTWWSRRTETDFFVRALSSSFWSLFLFSSLKRDFIGCITHVHFKS